MQGRVPEKLRYFQEQASGTLKLSIDGSDSLSFTFHKSIEVELFLTSVEKNVCSEDLRPKKQSKQLEPSKIMPGRIISTNKKQVAASLNNRSIRIELKDVLSSPIDHKKQTLFADSNQKTNFILVKKSPVSFLPGSDKRNKEKTAEQATQEVDQGVNLAPNPNASNKSVFADSNQKTNFILVKKIPVNILPGSDKRNKEKTAEQATQEVDQGVNLVPNLNATNKSALSAGTQVDPKFNRTSNPNNKNISDSSKYDKLFKVIELNGKSRKRKLPNILKRSLKKPSVQPHGTIKTEILSSLLTENLREKKIQPKEPEVKHPNLKATGKVTCKYCNTEFSSRQAFLDHTNLSALSGPKSIIYQCSSCAKVFSLKAHLEAHAIVYHPQQSGEKPVLFKCNYCDLKSRSYYGLKKHIMRHTKESEFKCCICSKEFRSHEQLQFHYNHHSSSSKIQRRRNIKLVVRSNSVGTATGEVTCKYCGTVFSDKNAFSDHTKINSSVTFQCSSCSLVFPFEGHLQAHMVVCHPKDTDSVIEKPSHYKCVYCDCTFKRYRYLDLQKHIMRHTGELDSKCCICSKELRSPSALRTHYSNHKLRDIVQNTTSAAQKQKKLAAQQSTTSAAQEQNKLDAQQSTTSAAQKQNKLVAQQNTTSTIQEQNKLDAQQNTTSTSQEQNKLDAQQNTTTITQEQNNLAAQQTTTTATQEQNKLAAQQTTTSATQEQNKLAAQQTTTSATQEQNKLAAYLSSEPKTKIQTKDSDANMDELNINCEVTCPHCNIVFANKRAFVNHTTINKFDGSNSVLFQCTHCYKLLPFKAHLRAHVIVKHTQQTQQGDVQPVLYKCDTCDYECKHFYQLKKHILSHTGECDVKCCLCDKEFSSLSALNGHYRRHKSRDTIPVDEVASRLTCQFCGVFFPNMKAFSDHTKTHKLSGPNAVTYQCSNCPKVFPFKAHMKAHLIVHHTQSGNVKPAIYKCDTCYLICKDYHDLKRHIMSHTGEHDRKCCVCDKKLRTAPSLNAHYMRHSYKNMTDKAALGQHTLATQPPNADENNILTKKPHASSGESTTMDATCPNCNVVFPDKKALADHHKLNKFDGPDSVAFHCSSCPKVFPYEAHLQAHIISRHTERKDENLLGYKCNSCQLEIKEYKDLKRHLMIHTGEFDLKCCVCSREFRGFSALNIHLIRHKTGKMVKSTTGKMVRSTRNEGVLSTRIAQSGIKLRAHLSDKRKKSKLKKLPGASIDESKTMKEVTCSHCDTVFPNKKAFTDHIKLNKYDSRNAVSFRCSQCPRVFLLEAYLQAHIIVSHTQQGEKKPIFYKCNSCNFKCKQFYGLRIHIMGHTGEYDVKCCVCGKQFRYIAALNAHYVHHSSSGMVRCTCCNQLFLNREALGKHRTAVVEAKCHLCGEVYPNKTSRNQHYQLMHQHDILRCEKCTLLFSSQEELAAHMKRHQVNKKKPCHICGKLFSKIENHMIVHRSEPGVVKGEQYICDKCPFMSYNQTSLRNHLKIHGAEKPYKCPNCSKTFALAYSLRRHLKSHTTYMAYECDVCGKRCKEIGNLRVHQRIHSAVKRYSCPYCPQAFNYKNSLDKHIKNKHDDVKPCTVSVAGPSSESLNIYDNAGAQVYGSTQTLNLTIVDGLLVPDEQQDDNMPNALAQGVKCYIVDTETLSTIYEVKKEPIEVLIEQAMEVEDVASIIDVKHSYS